MNGTFIAATPATDPVTEPSPDLASAPKIPKELRAEVRYSEVEKRIALGALVKADKTVASKVINRTWEHLMFRDLFTSPQKIIDDLLSCWDKERLIYIAAAAHNRKEKNLARANLGEKPVDTPLQEPCMLQAKSDCLILRMVCCSVRTPLPRLANTCLDGERPQQ